MSEVEPNEKKVEIPSTLIPKLPNNIPLILRDTKGELGNIQRKLLIPRYFRINDLGMKVRRMIQISEDSSLFFFSGRVVFQPQQLIGDIFDRYKEKDGFLYIDLSSRQAFGSMF